MRKADPSRSSRQPHNDQRVAPERLPPLRSGGPSGAPQKADNLFATTPDKSIRSQHPGLISNAVAHGSSELRAELYAVAALEGTGLVVPGHLLHIMPAVAAGAGAVLVPSDRRNRSSAHHSGRSGGRADWHVSAVGHRHESGRTFIAILCRVEGEIRTTERAVVAF